MYCIPVFVVVIMFDFCILQFSLGSMVYKYQLTSAVTAATCKGWVTTQTLPLLSPIKPTPNLPSRLHFTTLPLGLTIHPPPSITIMPKEPVPS